MALSRDRIASTGLMSLCDSYQGGREQASTRAHKLAYASANGVAPGNIANPYLIVSSNDCHGEPVGLRGMWVPRTATGNRADGFSQVCTVPARDRWQRS